MPPVAKNKKLKSVSKLNNEKKVVSAQLEKKLDKKRQINRSRKGAKRGVILIRNLPNRFYEEQIKHYFDQFGHVTRVRLARSRKSGGTKGYAFVEFRVPEVAKIAAETMDNYLMFQKLVKAIYIPPEEQKFNYFKTSVRPVVNKFGKRIFTSRKLISKAKKAKKYNHWDEETYSTRVQNALSKLDKLKKKYADLDLNLDSIVIKPKFAKLSNDANGENQNSASESQDESGCSKSGKGDDEEVPKKGKVTGSLTDLLGETIHETDDSDDEDYVPAEDFDPNQTLEIPPENWHPQSFAGKALKLLQETQSESDSSFKLSDESAIEIDNSEEELGEEEDENDNDTDNTDSESENESQNEPDMNESENNDDEKSKYKENKKLKNRKINRLDNLVRPKNFGGISKKNNKIKNSKANKKLQKMKADAIQEIVKNKASKITKKKK